MVWSDHWQAATDGKWVAEAELVKEMPIFPVAVFSRPVVFTHGQENTEMEKWVVS